MPDVPAADRQTDEERCRCRNLADEDMPPAERIGDAEAKRRGLWSAQDCSLHASRPTVADAVMADLGAAEAPMCACGGPCEHDGSLAEALREQQLLHEQDPNVFPPPPAGCLDCGSPFHDRPCPRTHAPIRTPADLGAAITEGVTEALTISAAHLAHQREWSRKTFGPGPRTAGVCDHIRKELREIEADPSDLREWVDVIILAFDGAWRTGAEPAAIIAAIKAKQARNETRTWPDWRTADPNKAIEHDRTGEP